MDETKKNHLKCFSKHLGGLKKQVDIHIEKLLLDVILNQVISSVMSMMK